MLLLFSSLIYRYTYRYDIMHILACCSVRNVREQAHDCIEARKHVLVNVYLQAIKAALQGDFCCDEVKAISYKRQRHLDQEKSVSQTWPRPAIYCDNMGL